MTLQQFTDIFGNFYDCHGHTFDFTCVPRKFIPLISRKALKSDESMKRWVNFLRKVNPSEKDNLEKYSRYMGTMSKTQLEIFEEWKSYYPKGTKLNILPMDMAHMKAGEVRKDYISQLEEVLSIKRKHPNTAMISVMIDPRADLLKLYRWCKVNSEHINGLKLYPLLGYTSNDKRLFMFYELAEKYGWLVTIHGSPANAVHYRDRKTIGKMLPKDFPYYKKAFSMKNKCSNFAHPWHTKEAALKFPNVNFNIAHFNESYRILIITYMHMCKNIYSDVSFTYNEPQEQKELVELIKKYPILEERLLFGSDMYMFETENFGNPFQNMLYNIGIALFRKLAIINPRRAFKIV